MKAASFWVSMAVSRFVNLWAVTFGACRHTCVKPWRPWLLSVVVMDGVRSTLTVLGRLVVFDWLPGDVAPNVRCRFCALHLPYLPHLISTFPPFPLPSPSRFSLSSFSGHIFCPIFFLHISTTTTICRPYLPWYLPARNLQNEPSNRPGQWAACQRSSHRLFQKRLGPLGQHLGQDLGQ